MPDRRLLGCCLMPGVQLSLDEEKERGECGPQNEGLHENQEHRQHCEEAPVEEGRQDAARRGVDIEVDESRHAHEGDGHAVQKVLQSDASVNVALSEDFGSDAGQQVPDADPEGLVADSPQEVPE